MKVLKDLSGEIVGTNAHYFRFDEFNDNNKDEVLVYGYNALENKTILKEITEYKRKVYINVTMPTEFQTNLLTIRDNIFDEVYGVCPYSVNWLNKLTNSNKYKTINYPFSHKDIPNKQEKIYDVCYHGGLHGNEYLRCLDIMKKFHYRYITMTRGINSLTQNNLHLATNLDLSNQDKLNLISRCKISICYNLVYINNDNIIFNIKNREKWFDNEAFRHIDDLKIIPQIKSRLNEAAMCRTLNLVKKDPWNVVERYYTPNVDFVYFESNDELEDKISDILNNWGDYQSYIENAYNKSLNYTAKEIYNNIKEYNFNDGI